MNKTFPVQLDEELHKRVKHAAIDEGTTLQDWIVNVLKQRVGMEETNAQRPAKRSAKNIDHRRSR